MLRNPYNNFHGSFMAKNVTIHPAAQIKMIAGKGNKGALKTPSLFFSLSRDRKTKRPITVNVLKNVRIMDIYSIISLKDDTKTKTPAMEAWTMMAIVGVPP